MTRIADTAEQPALYIKPIPLMKGPVPRWMVFHASNSDEIMESAAYAWLVVGSKQIILIDCGEMDVEKLKSHGITGVEKVGTIQDTLKKEGLSPNDVDIIISTHLHTEHIAAARKFPRAKILVQKRELMSALSPHPTLEWVYPQETISPLLKSDRFELVDGDIEIEPGLNLMLTPGHSAGGQSVLLQAGDKKVIVTGFCCCDENMFPTGPKQDCLVMHFYENLIPAYQSMMKVKQMADVIVPLHEAKFLEVNQIP